MDFHGPRTQILEKDSAVATTTVLYTVPANKKFYLVSSLLETDNGAVGAVSAVIRNDSDVVQKDIGHIQVGATTQNSPAVPFFPGFPIELDEGWDIAVISSIASLTGTLNIFGFEVDA